MYFTNDESNHDAHARRRIRKRLDSSGGRGEAIGFDVFAWSHGESTANNLSGVGLKGSD